MYTINDLLTSSADKIPTIDVGYKTFVQNYISTMQQISEMSVTDLEDTEALFAKLVERSIKTTQLVKENYTDKKTGI
jgi:hypothetical protein